MMAFCFLAETQQDKAMHVQHMIFNPVVLTLSLLFVKESGAHAHPRSFRLGSTSAAGNNSTRDFLRAAGVEKSLDPYNL